jgi:hypothetical protein
MVELVQMMRFDQARPVSGIIATSGFSVTRIVLPALIRGRVVARDWDALDRLMRTETRPGGCVFERLRSYAQFAEIEFIIAIRSSRVEPDEDGIWHDDGTRLLAFSLSLTLDPAAIQGGRLEIRRRGIEGVPLGTKSHAIETPPFGTMIVFATGQQGFEHKINRVSGGERIIIAGWCT